MAVATYQTINGIKYKMCNCCKNFIELSLFNKRGDSQQPYCPKCISQKRKIWNEKNSARKKERDRLYRISNPDKHKKWSAKAFQKRKHLVNQYFKKRMREEPEYRLINLHRKRIINALKRTKKLDKSINLLGCSISFLKQYLESKFKQGMTWENQGRFGWHIDHIIPCAAFDLTKEEEQRKCFHYTNLQPLWAVDNLKKGDKIL